MESFAPGGSVHRSGYDGPVNIKQDNCYSLFCNFLSLHKRKLGFPGGLVVRLASLLQENQIWIAGQKTPMEQVKAGEFH